MTGGGPWDNIHTVYMPSFTKFTEGGNIFTPLPNETLHVVYTKCKYTCTCLEIHVHVRNNIIWFLQGSSVYMYMYPASWAALVAQLVDPMSDTCTCTCTFTCIYVYIHVYMYITNVFIIYS